MYYEATIRHDYITETNAVKQKSSKIIINNVNLFAEAEYVALKYAAENWKADNFDEPDVTFIKRSRIREFANDWNPNDKIYLATLDDVFINEENGKKKHTKYLVGVYATDIDNAKSVVSSYMKQGLSDLSLIGINETNFETVIE